MGFSFMWARAIVDAMGGTGTFLSTSTSIGMHLLTTCLVPCLLICHQGSYRSALSQVSATVWLTSSFLAKMAEHRQRPREIVFFFPCFRNIDA